MMFIKNIMYLKNLIFFQFVIYFFFVSIIFWLIQSFQEENKISIINKQNAQENLTEETLKLYSVVNSRDEILKSYKRYTDLSVPAMTDCLNYENLIGQLQALGEKYNLKEPIDVTINTVFLRNNIQGFGEEDEKIRINNYDVNVKFAAPNFVTFLAIFRDMYNYMPSNTFITFIQVRNEEILTPQMIYKLSTKQKPDLIYAKLTMYIRKLVSL